MSNGVNAKVFGESAFQNYRKAPVVVKALQINEPFFVETLEGVMQGNPGDYLIIGVKGERYPCKKDIFEATYIKAGEMKLIYVAGKYQGATPSETSNNIEKAEQAALKLLQAGWAVICMHKNTARFERWEHFIGWDHAKWLDMSLEILGRCDAIFMLDNWKDSKGANIEHEYATNNHIKMFYETDGIPKP